MKNFSAVRERLALAACTLLTGSFVQASFLNTDDAGDAGDTYADIGGLLYKEGGGRVLAKEGVIAIKHAGVNGDKLNLELTLDTLSGGSPNGALPSNAVQTFATPSGRSLQHVVQAPTVHTCTTASGVTYICGGSAPGANSIYDVAPGDLPLDKTFTDQRQAVSLSWEVPVKPATRLTTGAAYSHETDFQSMSVNGALAQDFNKRNTTVSLGVNVEKDVNSPVGGTPVPLGNYALFGREGDQDKRVEGLLLGVTQVVTQHWLTQFDLTAERSRGYQNDPYKIVSGLDSVGNVVGYIYESRPDFRAKRGAFWESRFALNKDSIDVSYRATRDDWGVVSGTADLRYRYVMAGGEFIEPHYRWYRQSAADFHRLYVLEGDPYQQFVSADPRLGEFTAQTIGLKFGYAIDGNSEVSMSAEFYRQQGTVNMPVLPQLQGLDLYPALGAGIIEANLQFRF